MSTEFYLKDGVFGPHDTLAAPETVVRTTAQNLSEPQKLQARTNIGVTEGGGTAVDADDITDATAAGRAVLRAVNAAAQRAALGLGTSATLNVPASGNAAAGEVVKGDDTRLSGGGGGSPGGSDGQVQYNNGGVFDGTANLTTSSGTPLHVKGLAKFSHSTSTLPGGIEIKDWEPDVGGFNNMSITGGPAWAAGNGIRFVNHVQEVRIKDVLVDGSFAAAYAIFGAGDRVVEDTIRMLTYGGNAYLWTMRYASSPYPPLIISAPTITFNTKSTAAWADNVAYGTAALTIDGAQRVKARLLTTETFTLAGLNSAYPSPAVGDRSFITDETTGTSHAAAVGGGSLERPVYYGNGTWRVGG